MANLTRAPRLVVAPVSPGFGQEWLAEWARAVGRDVVHGVDPGGGGATLFLPGRRRSLEAIPASFGLEDLLVLDEHSLLFDEVGWREELSSLPTGIREERFEEARGWPAALELSRRIGESVLPLHRHPLSTVAFERMLPGGSLRHELSRGARAPLLLPELVAPMGLTLEAVEELADLGHLIPIGDGWTLPLPLRRYLAGPTEPATALAIADLLFERRHASYALSALAEAGLWEEYLERLALSFEPQDAGEAKLRRSLARVPERFHRAPAYQYLLASLERMRGDLDRARERFGRARGSAKGELRARVENARGVVLALQGHMDGARKAFAAAVRNASSGRLQGEARHNRAGVYIRQGRYGEAEADLREAVASFRAGGNYAREARSLQLLALSWHRRGLLEEARRSYEEALELLGTLGQPTALLRTNLAEVLVLGGSLEEARAQLDEAAGEPGLDSRARGYLEVNRALLELADGGPEAAFARLEALLRSETLEANLREEAELLMARVLRQAGRMDEALEHARLAAAGPEGDGVAVRLELALCRGAGLDEAIEQARQEEARFELATALIVRGGDEDLAEALTLIRSFGFRILLETPGYASSLAEYALRADAPSGDLFPVRISVLGNFSVRFLGRTITLADFPTRKSAALLVRLALAGGPLARELLAEEFWGDAGNPLQNLQTALYHLSRTLGVQVVSGRKGTVELGYPVEVDLGNFESGAAAALDGPDLVGSERLRGVLALARGEPLGQFPEWFEEERRRAETLLLRLWRRLAELEVTSPQRTVEALEGVLALDPYDFESRRQLIELYRSLGQGEQARRHEERGRVLEREVQ